MDREKRGLPGRHHPNLNPRRSFSIVGQTHRQDTHKGNTYKKGWSSVLGCILRLRLRLEDAEEQEHVVVRNF